MKLSRSDTAVIENGLRIAERASFQRAADITLKYGEGLSAARQEHFDKFFNEASGFHNLAERMKRERKAVKS